MHRRSEVVAEARQREFECARAATGNRLSLVDRDWHAGLGKRDGGGQPVGARTHHSGILGRSRHHNPLSRKSSKRTCILLKSGASIVRRGVPWATETATR